MTELIPYKPNQIINSYDDVEKAAKAMSVSGFFQDTKSAGQAAVKIMAGRELGFGPFASMVGVNIIQGKPAFGANMLAAAVKASGKYNYRVTEMTNTVCSIDFYELFNSKWEKVGISVFTLEDAKKAGTKNLDKFPRNMLFARAMSNGVKWYCPDVMNGAPVYTPEELGADVDEDGNIIDITPSVVSQEPQKPVIEPDLVQAAADELGVTVSEVKAPANGMPAEIAETLNLDPKTLTLEQAGSLTSHSNGSAGKAYAELTVAELSGRFNAYSKKLKDAESLGKEERNDYEVRQAAAQMLMKAVSEVNRK